jgi:formate dehydrogenase maturation protein FdhE
MTSAYWISSEGEVITVQLSHILEVKKNPLKFGYTDHRLEMIHKKCKEKVGSEGNAREKIIREVVNKGWIRLRRYTNKYWSITINELSQKNQKILTKWASKMLKQGIDGIKEKDKYIPVHIVPLKKGKVVDEFTILDVSRGKL